MSAGKQLWGGRFEKATAAVVRQFNDSWPFDQRLWAEDIAGSMAWARALGRAGVLSADEVAVLLDGLAQVRAEFEAGEFVVAAGDEDVHTAVERRLTEIVGTVGGKLHTGRSRNDQVATDFRLWCINAHRHIEKQISELTTILVQQAEKEIDTLAPGFTHLQYAQPITFGHYLLSHFWPLQRDLDRLGEWVQRLDVMPLGSAALAGTAYPIDRTALAADLGFSRVSENSLDAVSDRDFVAEFLFIAAMIGVHLSRLAEQLIIYSSQPYGYVTLDDAYSTGSSLMPQKKNPDTLELTRGKAGRLIGRLAGMLATLKALPSAYDKDLQEDKEPVFEAYDTLMIVLPVMAGVIGTLQVNRERLAAAIEPGLLATELADYLVLQQGVPFRQAHELAGMCVRAAEQAGVALDKLDAAAYAAIHPGLTLEALREVFDPRSALARREVVGGVGPGALWAQLAAAKAWLTHHGGTERTE